MRFALWVVWICALVSFPFSFRDAGAAPVFAYSYAYLALGLLAGVFLHPLLTNHAGEHNRKYCDAIVLAVGGLLGLLIVVSEVILWVQCYDFALASLVTGYSPSVKRILFVLEGYCCSAAGFNLFHHASRDSSFGREGLSEAHAMKGKNAFLATTLLLLAGFCRLGLFGVPIYLKMPLSGAGILATWLVAALLALFSIIVIAVFGVESFQQGSSESNRPLLRFQIALACYSAGQVLWGLVSHAFGDVALMADAAIYITAVLLVCDISLICVLLKSAFAQRRIAGECVGDTGGNECQFDDWLRLAMADHGLTEREGEAVRFCLEGFNSVESAEKMGLKPSTVRNYLQRAYKKLGIANAEALPALFNAQTPRETAEDVCSSFPTVSRYTGYFILFVFICLFALPCAEQQTLFGWHFDHATIVGYGMGFLLYVGLKLSYESLVGHQMFSGLGNSIVMRLFFAAIVVLACVQIVLVRFVYFAICDQIDFGSGILLVGFSSCLFSLVISGTFLSAIRRTSLRAVTKMECLFTAAGLLLLLLSRTDTVWWAASCVMSAVALSVFCSRALHQTIDGATLRSEDDKGFDNRARAFGFGFVAVVAFVCGEQWHPESEPFLVLLQIVFLLAAVALLMWKTKRTLRDFRLGPLFAAFLIALALWSGLGEGLLLLLISLVLFGLPTVYGDAGWSDELPCLLGCGGGLAFGRLLVDRWTELLSLAEEEIVTQGVPSYIAYVTPSVMALLMLVGVICLYKYMAILESRMEKGTEGSDAERQIYFMRSRGIGEQGAEILLRAAQGMTAKQIAAETNYSVGRVNAICWEGYKKLNVHSRSELRECLGRAISSDG